MILKYARRIFSWFKNLLPGRHQNSFYFKLRPYSGNESTKVRLKKTWGHRLKVVQKRRIRNRIARLSRRINRRRAA